MQGKIIKVPTLIMITLRKYEHSRTIGSLFSTDNFIGAEAYFSLAETT